MTKSLLIEVERFMAETGLKEHRTGMLLAGNGRLVERLRAGRRIWPETQSAILNALHRERDRRLGKDAA